MCFIYKDAELNSNILFDAIGARTRNTAAVYTEPRGALMLIGD